MLSSWSSAEDIMARIRLRSKKMAHLLDGVEHTLHGAAAARIN